jgi:hypothetical protein
VYTYHSGAYQEVGGDSLTDLTELQWAHIAVCRRENVYYTFIEGQLISTYDASADPGNNFTGIEYMFGNSPELDRPVKAYYACWRVVKGNALYTDSFPPLTAYLDGDGYELDTNLVNRDLEDPADWTLGVVPGWTTLFGVPLKRGETDDGGTTAMYQPDDTPRCLITQDTPIPPGAKKLRLNGRIKSTFTDWDNSFVGVAFYDSNNRPIGGAVISQNVDTINYFSGYQEAWVPPEAVRCAVFLGNARNGFVNLNSAVLGCELWWLVDPNYNPFFTGNYVINGGFETGDVSGWLDSSVYTDVAVVELDPIPSVNGTFIVRRSAAGVANTLIGSIEQLDIDIPTGAQGLTLSSIMKHTQTENDRARLGIKVRDSVGALLFEDTMWGPTTTNDDIWVGNTLDILTLPEGASKVDVSIDWWMGYRPTSPPAAFVDDIELRFFNETAEIDTSEQIFVRREANSWFHINPVFSEQTKGMVPGPSVVTAEKFLRDDGSWQFVEGGSGGSSDANIDGGAPDTVYTVLDIDGGGV